MIGRADIEGSKSNVAMNAWQCCYISFRINLSFLAHKSIVNTAVEVKWVLAFKLDYT